MLAERVGLSGAVIGVERSDEAVELAREFVAARDLRNVEVVCVDARDTALPRRSFDLVATRLVLVNVPTPEQILAEAVALLRPGGLVACHELAWPLTLDPPLMAWERLYEVLRAYARSNDIDLFVGRRLPRLMREHGVLDVRARPIVYAYPVGHTNRMLPLRFAENLAERIVSDHFIGQSELTELTAELERHLEDPNTFVISGTFVQAWGRIAV